MLVGQGFDWIRLHQYHQKRVGAYLCTADFSGSARTRQFPMSAQKNIEWLRHRTEQYRSNANDTCEAIEDFEEVEKLGQGFTSADPLGEVDIGDGITPRPTYVNKNLPFEHKCALIELLKEYVDCFAWNYIEMPGLSRELVEHRLPIKYGFRPYKQPARRFNLDIHYRVKEEVERLLEANFIRPCRYAEWVSNIVPTSAI